MRKIYFAFLLLFGFIFFNGCQKTIKETEPNKINLSTRDAKSFADSLASVTVGNSEVDPTVTKRYVYILKVDPKGNKKYTLKDGTFDWGGYDGIMAMECVVKTTVNSAQHNSCTVQVDPNYVCVGGGCQANYNNGYGAYITESRPLLDKSGWVGSTVDHLRANSHTITTYAIGLNVAGISRQTLFNNIIIKLDSSSSINLVGSPTKQVYSDYGYSIIGGGAKLTYNGAGGMLIESRASSSTGYWTATGKDDITSDPSGKIRTYLIEINNDSIPGFGRLQTAVKESTSSPNQTGKITYNVYNTPWDGSSVITCFGGKSNSSGYGRFFVELGYVPVTPIFPPPPPNPNVNDGMVVITKDHINADSGTALGQIITIEKKP